MEMFMVLMVNGNVDNYLSIFINGYFIFSWINGYFHGLLFMLLRYDKNNFIPAI